jgi:hypothetical protein
MQRSDHVFRVNSNVLKYVHSYKYLCIVLNEFLGFQEIAKSIAMSASRALDLIISKNNTFGGFKYSTFTNCTIHWCGPLLTTVHLFGGDRIFHV